MMALNRARRSTRLVAHATSGGERQTTAAPRLIKSPTAPMVTPNPDDRSAIIPAGASMLRPMTKLPSAKAAREDLVPVIFVRRPSVFRRSPARVDARAGAAGGTLAKGSFANVAVGGVPAHELRF